MQKTNFPLGINKSVYLLFIVTQDKWSDLDTEKTFTNAVQGILSKLYECNME